jgi:hypothetical protein
MRCRRFGVVPYSVLVVTRLAQARRRCGVLDSTTSDTFSLESGKRKANGTL